MDNRRILVVGGGRWARVIVDTLVNRVECADEIVVVTQRNRDGMADWLARSGLSDSVDVRDKYPEDEPGIGSLAVIANAAHDHECACDDALSRGYNILVEKPFTLSYATSYRIQQRAASLELHCLAANVFRFGRHIEALARHLPPQSEIQSLRIEWADPAGENRHGESKRYDARITVVTDVMPHIASILSVLFGDFSVEFQRVSVSGGGSRVAADFRMNETAVEVSMQRNAPARVRLISAQAQSGATTLDFATEPGTISCRGKTFSADSEWHTHPSPLAAMLRSVISAVRNDEVDPRLHMDVALNASRMSELVLPEYSAAQLAALRRALEAQESFTNRDVCYALTEITQTDRRLSNEEIRRAAGALKRSECSWRNLSDYEFVRNLCRLSEEADA